MDGSWTSLHSAIEQANHWQQEEDERPEGNLWRYRYHVFDHYGRKRYTTSLNEAAYQRAQTRLQWAMDPVPLLQPEQNNLFQS